MRFGLLGPLAVWRSDGRKVTVPEIKVRALLADLLIGEGRPVSAERLCADLWGDTPPAKPLRALHTKVWQLRRALEQGEPGAGDLIVSAPPGYLLRVDTDAVDAHQFEALVARARQLSSPSARAAALDDSLALWRGPAVAEFADAPFAGPAAARWEELRLVAPEERAEARLALGEHSLLVGELEDLVARHPLRERLRGAQLRALYRAGRQTEALRRFEEFRRFLHEVLGLEPSGDLAALHRAILRQDPDLDAVAAPVTTAVRPVNNLPAPVTPLIGRESAIGQVRALLEASRLVTLTGIGGGGETRLAVAVALELADAFPDGARMVELAVLDATAEPAPDDVARRVAVVLDVREETTAAGRSRLDFLGPTERLSAVLRDRQMLLLLDNCEHVLDAVAGLADTLLRIAPGLRILATSREPLGIAGERLLTVPPLDLPAVGGPADATAGIEELHRSGAGQLFLSRAMAAAPDLTLDESGVAAVRSICQRLDGIPLALELAATRVRALGVHEVAARLADRFSLLTVGRRGAPARQQTLRAAIDWSWDLLGEREQVLLRRLSVHIGGCTLTAVERVCGGDGLDPEQVVDVLARLVDRSLVAVADGPTGMRYRLLESVMAYAMHRLREAGELDRLRRRQAAYYTEVAERALPHLRGPDQRQWLRVLDAEGTNIDAALDTAVRDGLADTAVRLVNAMAWYWFLRGRPAAADRAFAAALSVGGDRSSREWAAAHAWRLGFSLWSGDGGPPHAEVPAVLDAAAGMTGKRAMAVWFLGFTKTNFGDWAAGEQWVARALADFRALGDRWGEAAALATCAVQAILRGDLAGAARDGEQSAALFLELGDGWGRLQAMTVLADLAEIAGDHERASRLHRDGLAIAEALGLWIEVSLKLAGLGRIALLTGDYRQARELHGRAMRLAAEQGFRFGEQFAEVGLGLTARRQGDLRAAEAHLCRWLDWCRKMDGSNGVALILAELGFIAEQRGDADRSRRLHLEGFAAARATRDPRAIALSLEGLAGAEAVAGRPDHAALLLGAAAESRRSAGAPLPEAERGDVNRITALAESTLGPRAFAEAYERGHALPAGDVFRLVYAAEEPACATS